MPLVSETSELLPNRLLTLDFSECLCAGLVSGHLGREWSDCCPIPPSICMGVQLSVSTLPCLEYFKTAVKRGVLSVVKGRCNGSKSLPDRTA